MQKKLLRVLSVVLCLLMVLALLPSAAAEEASQSRENNNPDHRPHMSEKREKAEPKEGSVIVEDTPLAVGENTFTIPENGDTVYRPFKPSRSGYYAIYSTEGDDTYGYLTDAEFNQLTYNDDTSTSLDFTIRYQLKSGVTYYIGVRYLNWEKEGPLNVMIEKHDKDSCGDKLTWSFKSSTGALKISGTGDMWDFSYNAAPWEEHRENIKSVSVAKGATSIGAYAFFDCPNLTSVSLPASLKGIGSNVFVYCTNLQSITLPDGLDYIGMGAFYGSGLTAVCIPASVSSIGFSVFLNCWSLTAETFTVDIDNPYFKAEDGFLLSKDGTFLYWFLNTDPRTELTVPDGVIEINYEAFYYCQNLRSVILPEGLERISYWAFEACYALETITIPDSLTSIEYAAFYECDSLTDVFYQGTVEHRYDTLSIDEDLNDYLLNATWHYLDDMEPFDGTVEWNKEDVQFKGTTPYVIADGSAWEPRFIVKDADGKTVSASNYTYRYAENVRAGTAYVIVTMTGGGYEGRLKGWFKIYLPATAWTKVENTDDGIKVSWDPVDGAEGYVIYRRAWSTTTNGWTEFARWDNTTDTTWIDGIDQSHKVYAGTRYQYGVKAYFARRVDAVSGATIGGNVGDNYNLGVVGPLKTTVRITSRELMQLTAGDSQITAKWSGSKNFTGYQLSYATNAGFSKNVKTITINNAQAYSRVLTSLTNGTRYYVRVRSYHVFEGTTYYGAWSNVLWVTPGSGQTMKPLRAINVGENAYNTANPLYGCINDMYAMSGMLRWVKQPYYTETLPNSTSEEILNAIGTQFKNTTDSDVSLFSFSGHGNTSGIYTIDGVTLSFSTLASELSKVNGRVIILLDCCQSGAAIGKGMSFDADAFNRAAIEAFSDYWMEEDNGARSGELKKSKFIVITAASSSQYSYDGYFDDSGYPQGAFTAALIEGMGCSYPRGSYVGSNGSMPADANGDKRITLKELYDYAYSVAYNWTAAQQAQYYGSDTTVLFAR